MSRPPFRGLRFESHPRRKMRMSDKRTELHPFKHYTLSSWMNVFRQLDLKDQGLIIEIEFRIIRVLETPELHGP